jgi:succinate dehydrogenase / fumarate reductase cytochrome b subunit
MYDDSRYPYIVITVKWCIEGFVHYFLRTIGSSSMDKKEATPQFRNINVFRDLTSYRLPAAGIVSILHRVSGAILFLSLPALVWLFDALKNDAERYRQVSQAFGEGIFWIPGWAIQVLSVVLIWAILHHAIAGLRHLYMDATHRVDLRFGRLSAIATLVLSVGLTIVLAAKVFGLY